MASLPPSFTDTGAPSSPDPTTTVSPNYQACHGVRSERGEEGLVGTLEHKMLNCESIDGVGTKMMRVICCYVLGLTAEKALKLDFDKDFHSDTDLATV